MGSPGSWFWVIVTVSVIYPHCPQPHCRQVMQPEFLTMGPAHSGQTRICLLVKVLDG